MKQRFLLFAVLTVAVVAAACGKSDKDVTATVSPRIPTSQSEMARNADVEVYTKNLQQVLNESMRPDWVNDVEGRIPCDYKEIFEVSATLRTLIGDIPYREKHGYAKYDPPITLQELGVRGSDANVRGQLKLVHETSAKKWVAALIVKFGDAKTEVCKGERYVFLTRNKLDIAEEIKRVLVAGEISPERVGLSAEKIRAMLLEGLKERVREWRAKVWSDSDSGIAFAMKENNFTTSQLGLTVEEARNLGLNVE